MRRAAATFALAALSASCAATIPRDEHLASLAQQQADYEDRLRRAADDCGRAEAAAARDKADLAQAKTTLEERVAALETALGDKQRTLDDVTAQLLELQDAFSKLSSRERSQIEAHLNKEKARQAALAELDGKFRLALKEDLDGAKVEIATREDTLIVRFKDGALFGKGSSRLGPPARATLERLAKAIGAAPELTARVEVHTDSVRPKEGDAGDTWALTQQQGLAVVQALAKLGVDPTRISYTSFGQFRPVATNDTNDGRAANRRVEVLLAAPRSR